MLGGGGVSKEDVGSIITASMTSRFALVVFKMAGEVAIVGRSTNVAFSSLTFLHLLKSKMQRQLGDNRLFFGIFLVDQTIDYFLN